MDFEEVKETTGNVCEFFNAFILIMGLLIVALPVMFVKLIQGLRR